ncbi:cytochrome c biogenesis protein ResB [Microbacterium sediminicola]|uniref:Cytochrome c biogenesis protein ResB n=1 Tax=Microbacterium sediminicola TaxID=415210 RepID=A0ABN2I7K4_9MICO
MSNSPSEAPSSDERAGADPLRPSDHADADSPVTSPKLSALGWLRWGWTQLTSMRTALLLLLLLAIAAIPGSIVPQRSADPNGVTQYFTDNPDLAPILDGMQLFDVYTSAWFSAIYILLFISLIGCVIPRTQHHAKALRARPPRTPARLQRLDTHRTETLALRDGAEASGEAAAAVDAATQRLRKWGYRVERYDTPARGAFSVSAERGYARETGNLIFHSALVGLLIAVGVGGGFTYTGQTVIVTGNTFTNSLLDYTSFNPGRFVDEDTLTPYAITLDGFDVDYVEAGEQGAGQAGDFVARVTTQLAGEEPQAGEVRVNHPLEIAGDRVYLMGNGYAPTVTVRNADGEVIYSEAVPFLPQDANMTSLGVVKIPDGLPEQLGLVGFFYPTAQELASGALTSVYPDLIYPVLTFNVFSGDLGIDGGVPRSVYTLDTTDMTQLTGGDTGVASVQLRPGDTVDLPDGLGSITFEDASSVVVGGETVKRYVSLSIHRDAAALWVLVFAVIAVAGLLSALFIPRRRMWVKATVAEEGIQLEYAGLARGEDPTLARAVADLAEAHRADLDR